MCVLWTQGLAASSHVMSCADGMIAAGSKKKQAGPLFQVRWWRVVLDEAQSIKNPRTLAAHAAWSLKVSSDLSFVLAISCTTSGQSPCPGNLSWIGFSSSSPWPQPGDNPGSPTCIKSIIMGPIQTMPRSERPWTAVHPMSKETVATAASCICFGAPALVASPGTC